MTSSGAKIPMKNKKIRHINPTKIFRRKFFSTLTPEMTPFLAEIVNFDHTQVESILKELFKSVEIFQKFHREVGQIWVSDANVSPKIIFFNFDP